MLLYLAVQLARLQTLLPTLTPCALGSQVWEAAACFVEDALGAQKANLLCLCSIWRS